MKIDFKNISSKQIKLGSVFYLYGPNKKVFYLFCDFILGAISKQKENVKISYLSFSDFEKNATSQCDLFDEKLQINCIKGIEDKHLDNILDVISQNENIFILESGDYWKSKKITDCFIKHPDIYAIPSFDNNLTFGSICNLILPNLDKKNHAAIMDLLSKTDENFLSIFRKLELMEIITDEDILKFTKEYLSQKQTFMQNMEPISLIRYLMSVIIKDRVYQKKQTVIENKQKDMMEFLLESEMKIKMGIPLDKTIILNNS